jgi:hypothetical protein
MSLQNGRTPSRPEGMSAGPLRMVPLSEHRRILETNRNAVVEKRLSRKLEGRLGWADLTEVHIPSFVLSLNRKEEYLGVYTDRYRCFRNLAAVAEEPNDVETDADSIFSAANSVSSMSSVGSTSSARTASRYRQRYGRGGRVWVDRTLTTSEKEDLENTQLSFFLDNPMHEERMRFDPRVSEDEKPVILDEFDVSQIVYRAKLLPPPSPRMPGGPQIRFNPNMSSPQLMRPRISSPTLTRQTLPPQPPK